MIKYMYTDTKCETVPAEFAKVEIIQPLPEIKRVNGEITYKDAIREALIEEMKRDKRVIFLRRRRGGLRWRVQGHEGTSRIVRTHRVFNTPISEACICGTGVGAGDDRAAAGRRTDVFRFRADGIRPDQQPGGQMALHERRTDRGAVRAARFGGRPAKVTAVNIRRRWNPCSVISPVFTWSIRQRLTMQKAC